MNVTMYRGICLWYEWMKIKEDWKVAISRYSCCFHCILHYILLYILFELCCLFVQIKFIQNCQTYNHNPWRLHAALTIHLFNPTHPHVESFDLETDGGFQKGISKPMGFGPMTQTQWFKIMLCSCKPRRCCFAPPSSQMSLNSIDVAPNSFL